MAFYHTRLVGGLYSILSGRIAMGAFHDIHLYDGLYSILAGHIDRHVPKDMLAPLQACVFYSQAPAMRSRIHYKQQ